MGFLDFLRGKSTQKATRKESLIMEARSFVNRVNRNRALEPISSSLILKKGETAYRETLSTLHEPRAVRHYQTGGVGIRVMKGVYVGGAKGASESKSEWREIDEGKLTLTNRKLYFSGGKSNRTVPLNKLTEINPWLDAIEVGVEGREKPMLLSVDNPYIWAVTVHILAGVDNPSNIEETLDIEIA